VSPRASRTRTIAATTCWSRSARRNAFPWIERDCGTNRKWKPRTRPIQSRSPTQPNVFFAVTRVLPTKHHLGGQHGHMPRCRSTGDLRRATSLTPAARGECSSQKMGMHTGATKRISVDKRTRCRIDEKVVALKDIRAEVRVGMTSSSRYGEAHR